MVCEAYSAREYTGICRWLTAITGDPAQWTGEDARNPGTSNPGVRLQYWGLAEGSILETYDVEYQRRLVLSRSFTVTILEGVVYTYTLEVGSTIVLFTTTLATVQADVPALLAAAWDFSVLGLDSAGTPGGNGLVLTSQNATFTVTGTLASGGVPVMGLGWGYTAVSEVLTAETYLVQIEITQHTFVATYWGGQRGRGVAKRKCKQVSITSGGDTGVDMLQRCTGQVAEVILLTSLDRAALADGTATSTEDVAQIEITVTASTCRCIPIPILSGVAITVLIQRGEVEG